MLSREEIFPSKSLRSLDRTITAHTSSRHRVPGALLIPHFHASRTVVSAWLRRAFYPPLFIVRDSDLIVLTKESCCQRSPETQPATNCVESNILEIRINDYRLFMLLVEQFVALIKHLIMKLK